MYVCVGTHLCFWFWAFLIITMKTDKIKKISFLHTNENTIKFSQFQKIQKPVKRCTRLKLNIKKMFLMYYVILFSKNSERLARKVL